MAQGFGPMAAEHLACLDAQGRDLHVVQLSWQTQLFKMRGAPYFISLPVDVARIFGSNLHLLHHGLGKSPQRFT
ncbi:hypothetical protein D3C72_2228960 [compost metagenome]